MAQQQFDLVGGGEFGAGVGEVGQREYLPLRIQAAQMVVQAAGIGVDAPALRGQAAGGNQRAVEHFGLGGVVLPHQIADGAGGQLAAGAQFGGGVGKILLPAAGVDIGGGQGAVVGGKRLGRLPVAADMGLLPVELLLQPGARGIAPEAQKTVLLQRFAVFQAAFACAVFQAADKGCGRRLRVV